MAWLVVLELVLLVACMYHYELKITDYTPVTKEENNAMIITIPQMILIHLANPFTLLDWIKSKIAHRVFVTIDKMLMHKSTVIKPLNRAPVLWMLLNTIIEMIIDPNIASNCTIAEMILITLANFLCFLASLSKSIAHQTDPAIRITPSSIAIVEMATNGAAVVVAVIDCIYKVKRLLNFYRASRS